MEKRFNHFLRLFFAIVTVISNVIAFLAAVLYGGGVALNALFGWNLYFAIAVLGTCRNCMPSSLRRLPQCSCSESSSSASTHRELPSP